MDFGSSESILPKQLTVHRVSKPPRRLGFSAGDDRRYIVMKLKGILYIGIALCLYGLYLQLTYLWDFFSYPDSPVRHEYLIGIFLVGFYWAVAWVGLLLFTNLKKKWFSILERSIANVSGACVGIAFLVSVVLDFST